MVLRKRNACPLTDNLKYFGKNGGKFASNGHKNYELEEQAYEEARLKGITSGGYLIGRHPECGMYLLDVCWRYSH